MQDDYQPSLGSVLKWTDLIWMTPELVFDPSGKKLKTTQPAIQFFFSFNIYFHLYMRPYIRCNRYNTVSTQSKVYSILPPHVISANDLISSMMKNIKSVYNCVCLIYDLKEAILKHELNSSRLVEEHLTNSLETFQLQSFWYAFVTWIQYCDYKCTTGYE